MEKKFKDIKNGDFIFTYCYPSIYVSQIKFINPVRRDDTTRVVFYTQTSHFSSFRIYDGCEEVSLCESSIRPDVWISTNIKDLLRFIIKKKLTFQKLCDCFGNTAVTSHEMCAIMKNLRKKSYH